MKTLFKYGNRENGVELFISMLSVKQVISVFNKDQKIFIKQFHARDFNDNYVYLEHVGYIKTINELEEFKKDKEDYIIDYIEFVVEPDINISLNDECDFIAFIDKPSVAEMPDLFKTILTANFNFDVSSSLEKNKNKYTLIDLVTKEIRVYDTFDQYLELSPPE